MRDQDKSSDLTNSGIRWETSVRPRTGKDESPTSG